MRGKECFALLVLVLVRVCEPHLMDDHVTVHQIDRQIQALVDRRFEREARVDVEYKAQKRVENDCYCLQCSAVQGSVESVVHNRLHIHKWKKNEHFGQHTGRQAGIGEPTFSPLSQH